MVAHVKVMHGIRTIPRSRQRIQRVPVNVSNFRPNPQFVQTQRQRAECFGNHQRHHSPAVERGCHGNDDIVTRAIFESLVSTGFDQHVVVGVRGGDGRNWFRERDGQLRQLEIVRAAGCRAHRNDSWPELREINAERTGEIQPPAADRDVLQFVDRIRAGQNRLLDFRRSRARVLSREQRRRARHMRSRHRRAAQCAVTARTRQRSRREHRAEDADTRRGDVHGQFAVIREAGSRIVVVRRGNRDHAVARIACRIVWADIDVSAGISRRRHKHDPRIDAGLDRVLERLAGVHAVTVIAGHDVHTVPRLHRDHVIEGDDRGRGTRTAIADPESHDLGVPINTRHAGPAVARCCRDSGDMRAVTVLVHRVGIAAAGVDAEHVIHEPIAVVVDAVACSLARIHPHAVRQVGMRVVHSRIDNRDHHARRIRADVPRFGRIDIGIGRAAGLPGIVQRPHLAEQRIVWHRAEELARRVQFRIHDRRAEPLGVGRQVPAGRVRDFNHRAVEDRAQVMHDRRTPRGRPVRDVLPSHQIVKPHHELVVVHGTEGIRPRFGDAERSRRPARDID